MRAKKFEYTPFLFVTPPFLCGIIGGFLVDNWLFLLAVSSAFLIVSIGIACVFKRYELIASVAFFVVGSVLIKGDFANNKLIYEQKTQHIAQIESVPILKGRYWRSETTILLQKESDLWRETKNRIQLNIDTVFTPQIGHVITYQAKNYAFDSVYKSYYEKRGIFGKQYAYQVTALDTIENLGYQIASFRDRIAQRISAIDTSKSGATAIMNAVTVGVKSDLDYELKRDYRNTGLSHILAISGLHIGIIYAVLRVLLSYLGTSKRARIWRAVLQLLLLWSYAVLSGLSPSVLRAVIMFSLFSMGDVTFERKNSLNILLASAFIILAFDPMSVFDIGFQLSYLAMVGIVMLYHPISSMLRIRKTVLRWTWQMLVVTFTAQITTAPLVLYYFHQIGLIGFIANYFVWFTLPIIVGATLFFMITNLHFIGVVGVYSATAQNFIVETFARLNIGVVKIVSFPLWLLFVVYAVLFVAIFGVILLNNNRFALKNRRYAISVLRQNAWSHPTDRKPH